MAVDFLFSILAKIGEYLVVPVKRQLGYLLCYKCNIENFSSQVDKLEKIKGGVQGRVNDAERNGEDILPEVKAWLESVDKITKELREFSDNVPKESERCFNGHCPDLKFRYQRSRKAKKQTDVADELKRRGQQFPEKISYPAPPPAIGSTSTEDVEAFDSRKLTTKEIMEALRDDEISMIGIYGMAGVGKTTFLNEVVKQAQVANLFNEIVMAMVSQPPLDFKRIQGEIADILGLTFKQETVSGRARKLSERLKTKKKILVILDDLWDRVELETVGIPFGAQHKGCKILLTSRSENVCSKMDTQKNFLIGPLPEQEAWNLFRKMVGDSVDSLDLQPSAVEVAKKCAGLPLAIVTVARDLKHKGPSDWRKTASRLRMSHRYISAAFRSSRKNEAYLFMNNEYVLLDYAPGALNDKVLNGPLLICDGYPFLKGTAFAEHGIDCAFGSHNGDEAFIFTGNLCAQIDYAPHTTNGKIIKGPMTITAMFPFFEGTVFESGVDAAFESSRTYEAYLFKGNQYACINYNASDSHRIAVRFITQGFASLKNTIFESGIDAALASHKHNEAYLFKGDSYAIIDFAPGTTDDRILGGVKEILPYWPSLRTILP